MIAYAIYLTGLELNSKKNDVESYDRHRSFLPQNTEITGVFTMKYLLSCELNLDTVCIELSFSDGSMISIDIIAAGNEAADDLYQPSELEHLLYNDT